jgi:hypothetical protein
MSEREFQPRFGKGPPINWTKLRDENAQLWEALAAHHDDLARLVSEVEGLREALREYGQHKHRCSYRDEGTPCFCGFRAALGDSPDERQK